MLKAHIIRVMVHPRVYFIAQRGARHRLCSLGATVLRSARARFGFGHQAEEYTHTHTQTHMHTYMHTHTWGYRNTRVINEVYIPQSGVWRIVGVKALAFENNDALRAHEFESSPSV